MIKIFNNTKIPLKFITKMKSIDDLDIVDDVNALLKLGVGEPYRLEHIKQAYIQNNTIWTTDEKYLQRMKEKYLKKLNSNISSNIISINNNLENKDSIHCWKCGKKSPLVANFCTICGTSLFEVNTNQIVQKSIPSESKTQQKLIRLKIPIFIGIQVLIIMIIGVTYSMEFFDGAIKNDTIDNGIDNIIISKENQNYSNEINSKCGSGTIFDVGTNSCVLGN
jgi:hypothetical protein